jgi:hypothetical protein
LAAIFDGVTSLSDVSARTPGFKAARIAASVVSQASFATAPISLLTQVNQSIRKKSTYRNGVDFKEPATLWGTVGSVVSVDTERSQIRYAFIGDCPIVIGLRNGTWSVLTSHHTARFRKATLEKMAEAREMNIFDAREQAAYAIVQMANNRRKANALDGSGHGILNGMDSALKYIETGELTDLSSVEFVALLSDGILPPPTSASAGTNFSEVAHTLRKGGLLGLLQHTRTIEQSDPHLTRPRTKMHDDATGILLRFEVVSLS